MLVCRNQPTFIRNWVIGLYLELQCSALVFGFDRVRDDAYEAGILSTLDASFSTEARNFVWTREPCIG